MKIIGKSQKKVFFIKSDINNKKEKAPGRDAGHRSPEWGCTKTPIFNKSL